MAISNFAANGILDALFGNDGNFGTFTNGPDLFVALSSTDPQDSLTEPGSDLGYARLDTSAADWGAAAGGVIENTARLAFAEATGDWPTFSYFALVDGQSNVLLSGQIYGPNSEQPVTKTLTDGDTFAAAQGQFKVSVVQAA